MSTGALTHRAHRHSLGFSLVELMVAIAIGLLIMVGLVTIFVNSSQSSKEISKSAEQIESGRYAIEVLATDVQHAGYYGHLSTLPAAGALPDPCSISTAALLQSAIAYPVQGYRAPDLSTRATVSAACVAGLLANTNLAPGSDVLVVRRAETALATGAVVAGRHYIQANSALSQVQLGVAGANLPATNAAGVASTLFKRDGVTAADTRILRQHIYFVAPCRRGSGAGGACAAGDDTVPTLKRIELGAASGAPTLNIVPIADGVQFFKVEYGIDDSPNDVNINTGNTGDGFPERYTATPAVSDWPQVVSARIYIVTRSTEGTMGHVDDKTYTVGEGVVTTAANDNFKRQQFQIEVRLKNLGARREIPR